MKKIILGLFIISVLFMFNNKNTDIIIPSNAIRFRVIANSDNIEDQKEKMIIKEKLEKEIYNLISDAEDTDTVRTILDNNMEDIQKIIDSYGVSYKINYGYNYFPTKNYKGIVYNAGNYESLVITLGEGLGENFWCVLFPPLCLLDYEKEDVGDVEYQFYVKKIIDKF
ncbi:MAG: stage II sporulation protein R [Bacilli bacterium]|nr:stage II sporulation protein R [Bacilli bacterium]